METAINAAMEAYKADEVPVGAVVVKNGEVISTARNNREQTGDATGHAETLAIRRACEALGTWRLDGCELYVTLEPCPMCMGAIINSRIKKVVFGAKDPSAGACGSVIDLNAYPLGFKPTVCGGLLEDRCSQILSDYFRQKREQGNK